MDLTQDTTPVSVSMPEEPIQRESVPPKKVEPREEKTEPLPERTYFPLSDTLRLYAGWLLAWYFIVYAFGSYQALRSLPFHSDILSELFSSSLILSFSFACFLFLFFTTLHRLLGRSILVGIVLTLAGAAVFAVFQANA